MEEAEEENNACLGVVEGMKLFFQGAAAEKATPPLPPLLVVAGVRAGGAAGRHAPAAGTIVRAVSPRQAQSITCREVGVPRDGGIGGGCDSCR